MKYKEVSWLTLLSVRTPLQVLGAIIFSDFREVTIFVLSLTAIRIGLRIHRFLLFCLPKHRLTIGGEFYKEKIVQVEKREKSHVCMQNEIYVIISIRTNSDICQCYQNSLPSTIIVSFAFIVVLSTVSKHPSKCPNHLLYRKRRSTTESGQCRRNSDR